MRVRVALQEALPNATVKAVKAVNAVYQNVDLSRLMDRVLALSRNNILGAFPGTNPFGFQARSLSDGEILITTTSKASSGGSV